MVREKHSHGGSWRSGLAALSLAAASLFATLNAGAADNAWRMHMVTAPEREDTKWAQRFADEVNAVAGEELEISFYPSGSLGIQDVDLLRILPPGGAIQAAVTFPPYLTRDIPELANVIGWGVIPTREKLVELLPTLQEIYGGIYGKHGIELIGFINHPYTTFEIFCKEPINSIEALKSKKIRVMDKFLSDVWSELGVSAQIIGQYDLYLALSTGVVDCALHSIGLATDISLHEVAPHSAYLMPYNIPPWGIIVSKAAMDKLSPEAQAKIREIGRKITEESAKPFLSGEVADVMAAAAVKAGIQVIEPFSEADQEAFRNVALKYWEHLNVSGGAETEANYRKLREQLDR